MKNMKLFNNQFALNTARLVFFAGGAEGPRQDTPVEKKAETKPEGPSQDTPVEKKAETKPEARETKENADKDQADMVARKRQEQVDRAHRENLSTAKDLEARARNLLITSKSKDNNADEKNMNKDLVLQLAEKLLDIHGLNDALKKVSTYKPEDLIDARVKVVGETIFVQIVAKDMTHSYELLGNGTAVSFDHPTGQLVRPGRRGNGTPYMQDEDHFYAPAKKDERGQL